MAERSRAPARFSRGRLSVGLVLVLLLGAATAYGLSKLRSAPGPGRLIYAARQGVFEHDLASGRDRKIGSLPDDVEAAMPSPDGRYVAYVLGAGEVWLAGLEDDTRFQVAEQLTVPVGWTPDGRLVAGELLGDRDLVAVDPDGGRDVLLSGGYGTGSIPVWIDDDRFAVSRDEDTFIVVEEGRAVFSEDGAPLAASPDGAELLYGRDDSVYVAKIGDEELTNERRIVRRKASSAGASPAGFAAIATEDGVYTLEGGTKVERVFHRPVDWVGWARAGAILLFAEKGKVYAFDLEAASLTNVSRRGADVFSVLAFTVVP